MSKVDDLPTCFVGDTLVIVPAEEAQLGVVVIRVASMEWVWIVIGVAGASLTVKLNDNRRQSLRREVSRRFRRCIGRLEHTMGEDLLRGEGADAGCELLALPCVEREASSVCRTERRVHAATEDRPFVSNANQTSLKWYARDYNGSLKPRVLPSAAATSTTPPPTHESVMYGIPPQTRVPASRARRWLALLSFVVSIFAFWQAAPLINGARALHATSTISADCVPDDRSAPVGVSATASRSGIPLAGRRINQIRPGDWVLAENPSEQPDYSFGEGVNSAAWRLLHLQTPYEWGGVVDIWMLRSTSWLESQWRIQHLPKAASLYDVAGERFVIVHSDLADPISKARLPGPPVHMPDFDESRLIGSTIYLSIPELDVEGDVHVLSIGECPQISPRPGPEFQVVTAVFHHPSPRVLDIQIAGNPGPLGTTPTHLFWSADRRDFVRADDLRIGERLQQADGRVTTVTSVDERPGVHEVYNLEVQAEHVYHVTHNGLLVHNSCGVDVAFGIRSRISDLSIKLGGHVDSVSNGFKRIGGVGDDWDKITNSMRQADNIHFDLGGMSKTHFQDYLKKGVSTPIGNGSWTNAELATILSDPTLLAKTAFYDGPGIFRLPPLDWLK
ncbi:MAG: Hint domain-containing protein [Planctomycetaceae bacterium]